MKLCEHTDFPALLVATAQATGLNEQFVEKDYYVTEVLRIVADAYGDMVIFKGGTSLSKGWALIDRFSEDVDLFVNSARFDPPLQGARAIDRQLRALRDRVARHPGLDLVPALGQTIGGRGRADHLAYVTRFDALPGIASTVRLEPGIQSGDHPIEPRRIDSLVAEFLRGRGQDDIAEDLAPFDMTLLHFRRTFVRQALRTPLPQQPTRDRERAQQERKRPHQVHAAHQDEFATVREYWATVEHLVEIIGLQWDAASGVVA